MGMNAGIHNHRASWIGALLTGVLMTVSVAACGTAGLRTDRLKETGLTPPSPRWVIVNRNRSVEAIFNRLCVPDRPRFYRGYRVKVFEFG